MRYVAASVLCIFSALTMGACSSNEPKCSSRETQDTLKQILDQKLAPLKMGYPANGDINWTVINIVTTEQTSTEANCSGDVQFTVRNKDTGQQANSTKRLDWTAQRTDDGRIYVTAHGL